MTAVQDAALSRELAKQEQIILECMEDFVRLGMAYKAIKDGKLYRGAGFSRFEDYCKDRWQHKKSYVYYLVEAASLRLKLPNPKRKTSTDRGHSWTEWSVRPLTRCKTDHQAVQVAKKVLREVESNGKTLTASLVNKHVNETLGIKRESVKRPKVMFEDVILEWTGELERMAVHIRKVPDDALELFGDNYPERATKLAAAIERLEKSLQRVWERLP